MTIELIFIGGDFSDKWENATHVPAIGTNIFIPSQSRLCKVKDVTWWDQNSCTVYLKKLSWSDMDSMCRVVQF